MAPGLQSCLWTMTTRSFSRASRRVLLALSLLCVAPAIAGCDKLLDATASKKAEAKDDDDDDDDDKKKKGKKGKTDKDDDDGEDKEPKSNRANPGHEGRFVYKPEPPSDSAHKPYEALFTDGRFAGVVKAMEAFALPRDVPIYTGDTGPCSQPNAFYMSSKHVVFLCYPMARASYENFVAMGKSDQEASNLTRDAMTFVLLHEMGHALVGELGLGITGKEEDAVDELAALILIQNGKHDMAIAGTYALVLLKQFQGKGRPTTYFGEHSVSEARLYDIFCLILGSDPKKFSEEILRERPELRQRAPKCPGTYEKIDKAWTGLLKPHTR